MLPPWDRQLKKFIGQHIPRDHLKFTRRLQHTRVTLWNNDNHYLMNIYYMLQHWKFSGRSTSLPSHSSARTKTIALEQKKSSCWFLVILSLHKMPVRVVQPRASAASPLITCTLAYLGVAVGLKRSKITKNSALLFSLSGKKWFQLH